ncbi:ABC transporter substrate-binding protein [Clostridiaceae bacterium M8S5]|nr:ABC transporter substrate-binding protein [Clostridiaceae bacterium M8S5]
MKNFKKVLVIVLAMAMMMSLFVGCGDKGKVDEPKNDNKKNEQNQEGKDEKEEAKGPKVLRLVGGKVNTLNPHNTTLGDNQSTAKRFCGTPIDIILNEAGDGYELFPNHCKEIPTVDETGKVWTFKLREGLKYDDGTPVNADAYVYSYKMLIDPNLKNVNSTVLTDNIPVVNGKKYFLGKCKWEEVGIKKVDDLTFTIELSNPISNADFITQFRNVVTAPVHKGMYEANMNEDRSETKYGIDMDKTPKCIAGPFKLAEWKQDMNRKYVKNPDSPLAEVYVPDEITERVIEDAETELRMFENGEIDRSAIRGAKVDKYRNDPRVKYGPAYTIFGFEINTESKENPILANKDFRKALFVGMDRESIGKGIFRTGTSVNYLVTKAYITDYETGEMYRNTAEGKSVEANHPAYDKKLAKELFDKAYAANKNKKIKLEISYYEENDRLKKTAEFLQENYENLFGKDKFEISLRSVPFQVQSENVKKGDYQTNFSFSYESIFNPWLWFVGYKTDAPDKSNSYKNAEFDKLLDRCLTGDLATKKKERREALAELENMLISDYSTQPVAGFELPSIYSDRIKIKTKDGMYIPGIGFALLQAGIED